MISVDEALTTLLGLLTPVETETVAIADAAGRVLATPHAARRAQPPFPASAMDGYAVAAEDARPGATFQVIGEAAAGRRHNGTLGHGEAVRIFTGAPVPEGATRVVIQEDVERTGDQIRLRDNLDPAAYIRPAGGDFSVGETLGAPRRLTAEDLVLLSAMNHAEVTVARKPVVALIATGDELVLPGEDPGLDQIVASNAIGLSALLAAEGAEIRRLPVARDTRASLETAFGFARGADLIVTIGGASVGDHDLVAPVADALGMERAFYKVAMRPGKPLMAGKLGHTAVFGLPGNPVSSMVCAHIFLRPALAMLQGLPGVPLARITCPLAGPIGQNGPREHYMRARRLPGKGGVTVTPFERQDSSLTGILAQADCLLVRAPDAPALPAGAPVEIIPLRAPLDTKQEHA